MFRFNCCGSDKSGNPVHTVGCGEVGLVIKDCKHDVSIVGVKDE